MLSLFVLCRQDSFFSFLFLKKIIKNKNLVWFRQVRKYPKDVDQVFFFFIDSVDQDFVQPFWKEPKKIKIKKQFGQGLG